MRANGWMVLMGLFLPLYVVVWPILYLRRRLASLHRRQLEARGRGVDLASIAADRMILRLAGGDTLELELELEARWTIFSDKRESSVLELPSLVLFESRDASLAPVIDGLRERNLLVGPVERNAARFGILDVLCAALWSAALVLAALWLLRR
jgi:hypothetical protein